MIKIFAFLSLLSSLHAASLTLVSKGKLQDAKATGQWTTSASGLSASGKKAILSPNKAIAAGDFHLKATLTLASIDGTAAGVLIDHSVFGFDSAKKTLFTEGPVFGGATKYLASSADHITPGKPFRFELIREGKTTRILIDGTKISELKNWNPESFNLSFRPWRNTISIQDATISGTLITPPKPRGDVLFASGDGRYHTYRIPALTVSKKGTLLAFAEGRNSRTDHGNIDILLRRSTDNGKSWGKAEIVRDHGVHQAGNPAPLVDLETGRIFLFHCTSKVSEHYVLSAKGTREVEIMHSDDDGLTWSKPRNISAMTKKKDWRWYATGPCSGIQIQTGKHKGRLVMPANHSIHYDDGRKWEYRCHSLVSDDHGKTWEIGSSSEIGGSETQIAEVSPDLLLQDIRMQTSRKGYRAIRFSKDGGLTWDPLTHDRSRLDPKCQGSAISTLNSDGSFTLYSSNPAHVSSRVGMTVYRSLDGKDWKPLAQLTNGPSAYSDLAFTKTGQLTCLYEAGENDAYESIVFAIFPALENK